MKPCCVYNTVYICVTICSQLITIYNCFLLGYQPFSYDLDKQSRYEAYLKGNRSRRREATLTDWENEKEMREFDRLAKVHKPLTTTLSDRFTRGTEQEVCVCGCGLQWNKGHAEARHFVICREVVEVQN